MKTDARSMLTTALKIAIMCSPAAVVPLTGMTVDTAPRQTAAMRVTSTGFTFGKGFTDVAQQTRTAMVVRGLLHVMLGHPGALRDAIQTRGQDIAQAFDVACQMRVEAIIEASPRLPSGMFFGDRDILTAMSDLGLRKKRAYVSGLGDVPPLETLVSAVVANPLPGIARVLEPAGSADTGHASVLALMADAMPQHGDLVAHATELLGMELPADAQVDATGWILRVQPTSVASIEEAKGLLARLDALRLTAVSRAVAMASVLETVLGTLKRNGVKATEVSKAFGAECEEACRDIFAAGPLVKLA